MARQKTDPLHVVVYPSNFNGDNGQKMLYVGPRGIVRGGRMPLPNQRR